MYHVLCHLIMITSICILCCYQTPNHTSSSTHQRDMECGKGVPTVIPIISHQVSGI